MSHLIEHENDLGIDGFKERRVIGNVQEVNEHLLVQTNPLVVHQWEGDDISGIVVGCC